MKKLRTCRSICKLQEIKDPSKSTISHKLNQEVTRKYKRHLFIKSINGTTCIHYLQCNLNSYVKIMFLKLNMVSCENK